ncbi:cell cycle control protein (Cwf26) [Cordyceps militaris CM01]|uniref:Cell cycle control protein (Cwf26) n=1 Tax=Cordyceps militaris (strain CM01) TaxID=983644 RepID=G3J401_CORMM|nr:cell cycle control protein (Cwf26) [Cordyceps militaris CM01]EGX95776.1 cell cycle control protein (Cwf26) [Cordyceps militaris CM01]
MPSDLSNYLASKYLVADAKPKKKKRKQAAAGGLLITDDDDGTWGQKTHGDDDADDGPVTVTGASAEFRRAKKNNWKPLGGGDATKDTDDTAAADAILASAAAESAAARAEDEEMPLVADDDDHHSTVKMSDGTHAGLQSAATVSAQLRRRQREERAEFERHRATAQEEETVYRDATGRRIDISMRRAEARRMAAEAEDKERLAKEALKGEVQQEEARQRRELLEDAKLMPLARGADDEAMNQELKAQERWNDPMMQFMSGGGRDDAGKKGKSKRRPVYAGAAPPNRYGIKPGYRWDGVDRGTGFEAERFKALNRMKRNEGLDYAWQMDE